MKEEALRETHIRSIYEIEFCVQKLRESHDTKQRLTSQIQELQERMNYLNGSGELHEVESNFVGNFSDVQVNQQ